MSDYKHLARSNGSEAGNRALAVWHRLCDESACRRQEWIRALRQQGIRAAHPDDGWVNRADNEVHLCYPHFDDGLGVGDLLALGWESRGHRVVRVTGVRRTIMGLRWYRFNDPNPTTDSDGGEDG